MKYRRQMIVRERKKNYKIDEAENWLGKTEWRTREREMKKKIKRGGEEGEKRT